MTRWFRALPALAFGFALLGCESSFVDDPAAKPKAEKKADTPKPPTYRVDKGPFKVEVTLKGVFEAPDRQEVSLGKLEAWTPQTGGQLIVKKAVEHGTAVRQGDQVLWLEMDKIDRAIHDLEGDLKQSAHALKQAEEELPILEKALPLELAATEWAKKTADEDLKRYHDEERGWSERIAHFVVKMNQQDVEYAKEELRQLQKMYRSKDLTEETEEIILKRQRNNLEMMEFFLRLSEVRRDQTLKISLPRREQQLADSARKSDLDLLRAKTSLPLAFGQKRLSVSRQKYEFEKSTRRLEGLKKDREAMIVKAPADGIVYHGKCVRGQWQGSPDRLQAGSMLLGPDVLLTIVKSRPLIVRAAVEEKELRHLRTGLAGKASPTSFPDLKLPAKVDNVSAVPVSAEKFDARIAVELGKDAEAVMPGMACAVKFIVYQNANALTVPASAVFTDELDEDQHYVYVPGKDGKAEKRTVKVARRNERRVEIADGLKEGDEVLQDKPKEDKP